MSPAAWSPLRSAILICCAHALDEFSKIQTVGAPDDGRDEFVIWTSERQADVNASVLANAVITYHH